MKTNDQMTRRRYADFPEPIQQLAKQNAVINRVIHEYAHGNIITRDEALAQMVVRLAQDWTALNEEATRLAMQVSPFISRAAP